MSETPSKTIVASLMAKDPAVKDRGFRKTIRGIPELAEFAYLADFVPDAYKFDHAARVITLVEVDDTNPIDRVKASKIGEFSDYVLGEDWDVRVLVIDYAGGVKADVPGWSFMLVYTETLAGPRCNDFTPAAAGVARMIRARSQAPYSADELADRLG